MVTGQVIRTTYGFIAGIIGLFLSSLCVIKVVRLLFYLFSRSVLNVFAETRDRAVQEDRRKAWRWGLRVRDIVTTFPFSPCLLKSTFSLVCTASATFSLPYSSSNAGVGVDSFMHRVVYPATNRFTFFVNLVFSSSWFLG
jgi:hypothetical protein